MHRRGLALLLGFLAAVVIVGGGGVRAPWLPLEDPAGSGVVTSSVGRIPMAVGRIRME